MADPVIAGSRAEAAVRGFTAVAGREPRNEVEQAGMIKLCEATDLAQALADRSLAVHTHTTPISPRVCSGD